MEDQKDGLLLGPANGLLDVLLVLREKFGVEFDIARLVDTVHIAKPGRNGEVRRDRGQCLVDGENVLGLGVEGVIVDVLIVDAILFPASDADLLDSS